MSTTEGTLLWIIAIQLVAIGLLLVDGWKTKERLRACRQSWLQIIKRHEALSKENDILRQQIHQLSVWLKEAKHEIASYSDAKKEA